MNGDTSKTNDRYEVTYRATRDALLSTTRTAFFGVLLFFVGVFGLGMVWMTATAFSTGTATRATFPAGLFGVATTVFSGYELYHLRRDY